MLRRPTFPKHLRAVVSPGEGVLLVSDGDARILRGAEHEALAPLLDGRLTLDEIVEALEDRFDPALLYFRIGRLEQAGLLVEETAGMAEAEQAFWHSLALDPPPDGDGRPRARLDVRCLAPDAAEAWRTALRDAGVRLEEESGPTLAVTDSYLRDELNALNAAALKGGRPWLLVRPSGARLWLGPLFVPGVTGCWRCLRHRLARNEPGESFTVRHGTEPGRPPTSPLALRAAAGLVATQLAVRAAGRPAEEITGAILDVDLLGGRGGRHVLARRPQCPGCGRPEIYASRVRAPLRLRSSPKRFRTDGGHRTIRPEEFVRRLQHLIDPITGIIPALRRLPFGQEGVVEVYESGSALRTGPARLEDLRRQLGLRSGGKGLLPAQARASALGEAIERYCGCWQGDEPTVRGTLEELGPPAVHPNDCMLFSERQLLSRSAEGDVEGGPLGIPRPLEADRELDWTPVWSLSRREFRFLPTTYLYYGHPAPAPEKVAVVDSNGASAGASREEALLQGLMELVERDAVAIWWYNRVPRPAADLGVEGLEAVGRVAGYLDRLGLDFWVLDLTADLDVPVYAAVARERAGGHRERVHLGFGAHLDPLIALRRSVAEVSQVLASSAAADGGSPDPPDQGPWLLRADPARDPYLFPASGDAVSPFDHPSPVSEDLLDDVLLCRRLLEDRGLEVLVLDQSRPDVDVAVVKVIVPGLRHFWPRFAPGRLYEVPAALDWLSRARREEELNRIPLLM